MGRFRSAWSPFKSRNFTLYALVQTCAFGALWMQRVATDWAVLQHSGRISSVGVATALQFLPTLLLGPLGGIAVDRLPRRLLVIACQTACAVGGLTLATLMTTGAIQLWHIYAVCLWLGLVSVLDSPLRSVVTSDLVPPSELPKAVSLGAATFHVGSLLGSGVGGLLIASRGVSTALLTSASVYLFATLLMLAVSSGRTGSGDPMSVPSTFIQLIRPMMRSPRALMTLLMVLSVSLFGMNLPLILAAMAHEVFESGGGGYGLLNAVAAGGALIGALIATFRSHLSMSRATTLLALYGVAQLVAGTMGAQATFAVVLLLVTVLRLLFITMMESMVLASVPPMLRGRLMSLYMVTLLGGQALGSLLVADIADRFGPRTALGLVGAAPLLIALAVHLASHRRPGWGGKISATNER